jgi:diacylglycerol kinase (ATP)
MDKRALMIVNPASGNIENQTAMVDNIILNTSDYLLSVWNTTGQGDEEKVHQLLEQNCYELIMVGGGDGTIKLVASQLEGHQVPLLPIPFGSANGLSSCLGIQTWEDSIFALKAGNTIQMDVLNVNGEVCLHLCDFGFNAGLIKRFEESDERGMGSYFKSSVAQLFENNKYSFNLQINGEKKLIYAKMLVIANGDRYGTGAKINPTGKLDDGHFEIIALNPDSLKEWMALMVGFIREDFSELDFVQTFRGDRASIENLENAAFHIDGEMVAQTAKVDIQLSKMKIEFYTNFATQVK